MRWWVAAFFACVIQAQPAPQFTWKGEVDGVVVIHLRGRRVNIEYKQGGPVKQAAFRFASAVPDGSAKIRLEVREGRGSVQITEQPGIENNYTAAVIIDDLQDGPSFYWIELYWEADRFADDEARPGGRTDHLTWRGHVDSEVVVECRARQCEPASVTKFTQALPEREVQVMLDSTEGRADFRIIEQPSARNGFRARVRIRPLQGSAHECSFVLSWARPPRR